MIEFLRGNLLLKEDSRVLLDVAGVGYGAELTSSAFNALPGTGEIVDLHVYLYVQEGILRLYGFSGREERSLFEMFLGTSGIGPKTALAILSTVAPHTFARAILQEDLKTLTAIPGIGRKTAERLIIELREKVKGIATPATNAARARPEGLQSSGNVIGEAIEALQTLGCKPIVAERAIQKALEIVGEGASVSELVREGLKHRR